MYTCKIKYDDIGFVIHEGPQHIVYYLYYFNHCRWQHSDSSLASTTWLAEQKELLGYYGENYASVGYTFWELSRSFLAQQQKILAQQPAMQLFIR